MKTNVKGLISVIIPIYNAADDLRKCLDSITSQTYDKWECILINDGSSDESAKICETYAIADKRFRAFHQPNSGVSSARNRGLEESKGELIAFVDADDWLDNDYLETLVAYADSDLILYGYELEPYGYRTLVTRQTHTYTSSDIKQFATSEAIFYGYPWGKLFHKSIISANGIKFPQIKVYEDLLFYTEYIKYCGSISCLSETGYHYVAPQKTDTFKKYPQSPQEVAYLITQMSNFVNYVARKFNCPPPTPPFDFYRHLNLEGLDMSGIESELLNVHKLLRDGSEVESFYKNPLTSPIASLLHEVRETNIESLNEAERIVQMLTSEKYRPWLRTMKLNNTSEKLLSFIILNWNPRLFLLYKFIIKIKGKLGRRLHLNRPYILIR